ncbi:MAG: SDR family oxidoreductase [Candidatus Methylacidiphilales bacterium]|nr:SDR family oxidoreductase [Candidatus Methylacidiphilales bacterium]
MRFENRLVLVTGAGSGLGRALALALAAEGAQVALLGRRPGKLSETAELIRAQGGRVWLRSTDVSVSTEVATAVGEIQAELGPVDALVNNAGFFPRKAAVQETDIVDWDQALATNLRGPFLLMRAVLPGMLARDYGRIVNISAPLKHYPTASAYCASKCALDSLTKTTAFELRGKNILVNAVEPPFLDTEMHTGGRPPFEAAPPILDLLALPDGSPTGRVVKLA